MNFTPKRMLKIMVGVFIAAIATGYYWQNGPISNIYQQQAGSASLAARPVANQNMPDISFYDPNGKPITLNAFKGKYVLINMWATWCGPCVVELPSLDALRARFKEQNLAVIAISIDQGMGQTELKTFLTSRGISDFALYHDTQKDVQSKISLPGIPVTYLLNPARQVIYVFEGGADWTTPQTIDKFSQILKKS